MKSTLLFLAIALITPGVAAQERAAPQLDAVGLDGVPVQLSALRGRVVIVDFWATWCSPCRGSLDAHQALVDEFGERRLTVIAVAIDRRRQVVEKFVKAGPWSLLFVWDERQRLARSWRPTAVPTTYLITQNGQIHSTFSGYDAAHFEALRHAVKVLLRRASGPTGSDMDSGNPSKW